MATCSATSGDIVVMEVDIDLPPGFPAYVCAGGTEEFEAWSSLRMCAQAAPRSLRRG